MKGKSSHSNLVAQFQDDVVVGYETSVQPRYLGGLSAAGVGESHSLQAVGQRLVDERYGAVGIGYCCGIVAGDVGIIHLIRIYTCGVCLCLYRRQRHAEHSQQTQCAGDAFR